MRSVGDLYDANRIADVWCADWETTLADVGEWYPQLLPDRVVVYLDPPYLAKSPTLYGTSFDPAGGYSPTRRAAKAPAGDADRVHRRLATHLRREARYRWILSYDHQPAITSRSDLYLADRMTPDAEAKRTLGVKEWRISKRLVSLRYTASGSGRGEPTTELLLTTLPPLCVPADERLRSMDGSSVAVPPGTDEPGIPSSNEA